MLSIRSLCKLLLTCTIVALVLLVQLCGIFTAFADSPADVPPAECLNISGSTALGDTPITITSPPGQAIAFTLALYILNSCSVTVNNITFGLSADVVCPAGTVNSAQQPTASISGPSSIQPGQTIGNSDHQGQAYCEYLVNNVPTTAVAPSSITITLGASGVDYDGNAVVAPSTSFPFYGT